MPRQCHGGVYTPQIIVDGVADVVGSRVGAVEAAIAERRADLAQADMARARTARVEADAERAADAAHAMPASMPVMLAMPAPPVDPVVPVSLSETPQEMHIEIGAVPGERNATVWMFHLRAAVSVNVA